MRKILLLSISFILFSAPLIFGQIILTPAFSNLDVCSSGSSQTGSVSFTASTSSVTPINITISETFNPDHSGIDPSITLVGSSTRTISSVAPTTIQYDVDGGGATTGGTLTILVTQDGTSNFDFSNLSIDVNFVPVLNPIDPSQEAPSSGNGVLCGPGDDLTLTASLANDAFDVLFVWTRASVGGLQGLNASLVVSETDTWTVEANNTCGSSTDDIIVGSGALATFEQQPTQSTSSCAGGTALDIDAVISRTDLASNATYVWQRVGSGSIGSTTTVPSGSDPVDAVFPTGLVTFGTSPDVNGTSYRLRVFNDGCNVNSDVIQVKDDPGIVSGDPLSMSSVTEMDGSVTYTATFDNATDDFTETNWTLSGSGVGVSMFTETLERSEIIDMETVLFPITPADGTVSGSFEVDGGTTIDWEVTNTIGATFTTVLNVGFTPMGGVVDISLDVGLDVDNICGRATYGGASQQLLPVEFGYFRGQELPEGILLEWSTEMEASNDFFTVERSYDGISFEAIHREAGAGDSNTTLHYSFLDASVSREASVVYYRIRQTDFDGTYDFSPLVQVNTGTATASLALVHAYVAADQLNYQFQVASNKEVRVELYDLGGRLLRAAEVAGLRGVNSFQLPLDGLSAGIYVLRLSDSERAVTERFLR